MINLIPNEEKKKKVKDFYFRLAVVFFIVLGFSLVVATTTILPAYFLSLEKKNFVNTTLENQKKEPVPLFDQKNLTAVNDIKNKLKIIENAGQNTYVISTQIINEILLKKMPDIKIMEISYDNTSTLGKTIILNGFASSRERLLLFRRALEDDVAFKKVNLPISNFIKGSNIQFSFSLIPS
jgi:hypothetical protein